MLEDYRYRAAECLWLADEITDPKHRKSLIEMASAWMRLYEHARKNGQANLSLNKDAPVSRCRDVRSSDANARWTPIHS
jgi:hypothetical protein